MSPSGGFSSLVCDQGLHFASIKLCLALSRQGAVIKIPVVRCHCLWCFGAQYLARNNMFYADIMKQHISRWTELLNPGNHLSFVKSGTNLCKNYDSTLCLHTTAKWHKENNKEEKKEGSIWGVVAFLLCKAVHRSSVILAYF